MGSAAATAIVSLAVLAPGAQAACPTEAGSPVFAAFGDQDLYVPFPGGSFEAGTAGWQLSGPAAVAADNESFQVNGASDAASLELGPGAVATTPPVCVGTGDRIARLFVRNLAGPKSATLSVDALFSRPGEKAVTVKDAANLNADEAWDVTRRINLSQGRLKKSAAGDDVHVQLRFSAARGSTWRIDDVYVDPRYRG
jgi:hypothetical protein